MNKGQNIIEFVLILSVVIIAAILTLVFFGKNVQGMLSKSHDSYKPYKPFDYNTTSAINSPMSSSSNTSPASDESFNTTNPAAPDNMVSNPDGSFTLGFNNQQYTVSNDIVALMDVVMSSSIVTDATGSQGNTVMLANMVNYMISQHIDEYPEGVPLEIYFGDSVRIYGDTRYSSATEEGKWYNESRIQEGIAEANMINIKVGNHLLIFQHDQACDFTTDKSCGNYHVEGYIQDVNGSKVLEAGIKSEIDQELNGKTIELSINTDNGLKLNGLITDIKYWQTADEDGGEGWDDDAKNSIDWDFTFNDPAQQFTVPIQ